MAGILLLSIIIGTRDERERGPKILSSFPFDIFFDRYRENNGPYKRPERPQIYRCIPCLVAVERVGNRMAEPRQGGREGKETK